LTDFFNRATAYSLCLARYAIACPSVCLSLCLSVTQVHQSKTVEIKIMKFSIYGTSTPLVSAG